MSLRNVTAALSAAAGMAVLILDGHTALQAASMGIDLCLRTVVPSLFPFLFLCKLLTDSLWGKSYPFLKPLGRKLGIPEGGESLLIAAALGGYPVGALALGEGYKTGTLKKEDAEHLLTFCSNAGPAFLFGMMSSLFPDRGTPWILWGIHLLSALMAGLLFRRETTQKTVFSPSNPSVSQTLAHTVKTMGVICGWIVLFRILSDFLTRWFFWYFPEELQVLMTGLLELSNGCCALSRIEDPGLRFLAASVLLSFGGLCVAMQTASVIGSLSIRPYLLGKVAQTIFAASLSFLYLRSGWMIFPVIVMLPVFFLKKEVDFLRFPVYNASITTGRNDHAVSQKN